MTKDYKKIIKAFEGLLVVMFTSVAVPCVQLIEKNEEKLRPNVANFS